MTSPDPPPVRTRKVIHGTCSLHRGPIGFANVVVTKHGGMIEFDPHVTGAGDGTRTVREGGPTPLWAEVERAYLQWRDCGEPGWDRVGITATPQSCTVWLDEPHNVLGQVLPPA